VTGGLPAPRPLIVALLLVGVFMSTFIAGGVAVALPALGSSLHLSFSTAVFVQASYVLSATIFLIPAGRLADARGRVDYYLAGLAVFALSSLLAGLAPTASLLIAARCLQGVGAALIAATNEAILVSLYPDRRRGHAIAINVTVVYLGVMLGPVLGGLLTDERGWRWIFFANVPVASVAFVLLARLRRLPGLHEPGAPGRVRIDLAGSTLLAAAVTPAIVALSYAPVWGWSSARFCFLTAAAVAAAVAFVAVETRVSDPILDLGLLRRNRLFLNATACTLLNAFAIFAVGLLVSLFLQLVQHRSVAATGLLLLAQPAAMVCCSPFFGRAYDRLGARALTTGGMGLIAVALFGLAGLSSQTPAVWIVTCLGLLGLGMSAFSSPNEADALGATLRSQFSTAASILGTARYIGQFLSLTVLGAVAAGHLGQTGARVVFLHARAGDTLSQDYAWGFRVALVVAAAIALLTAGVAARRAPVGRWAGPVEEGRLPG
jgi:EmrB/QacA subfamily drug resistance transporter